MLLHAANELAKHPLLSFTLTWLISAGFDAATCGE